MLVRASHKKLQYSVNVPGPDIMLRHRHKSWHGLGFTCNRNSICNNFKIRAHQVDYFEPSR